MSYKDEIKICESEIKTLGARLSEILEPLIQPDTLSWFQHDFSIDNYPEAIEAIKWHLAEQTVVLPDSALSIWSDIKNKANKAKGLYELERQSDDGFKNPITHMNALMEAGDRVPDPDGFAKRHGLSQGAVKALWLTSPIFEERFIRERIGKAIARNGARTGHYIFIKRRYKFTQEQAERLADDIWENPKTVSKVFYDLLDWKKLVQCRLIEDAQEEVLQIHADYES